MKAVLRYFCATEKIEKYALLQSAVGFLSPANRGSLVIAVIVLFVMMGSMSGYTSARLYKTFKGKEWQKCTT